MTIYDVIRAFFCAVVAWVYGCYRSIPIGIGTGTGTGLSTARGVNVAACKRFHDAMRGLGWEMGEIRVAMTAGARVTGDGDEG